MEQDPISGNTIPPGSTANEVRDNVDAKLSEGEYVLPADVVKYFGLDYIEKLIGKAKKGMEELHAGGRIGGQGPDDLPFSPEELQAHEAEMAQTSQEAPVAMAEGGLVQDGGWGITNDDPNAIDPATGLPYWMGSKKEQPKKQTVGTPSDGRDTTFVEPTGLAGSVDKWGPDDFLNYTKNKDSPVNKGLEAAVGSLVPFGGMLMKGRQNYLEKAVPEELDKMITSGLDRNGKPLSAEQRASLEAARASLGEGKAGTGLGAKIKDGINNLLHPNKSVSPTRVANSNGSNGGKREAVTHTVNRNAPKVDVSKVKDNETKNFKHGGLVTRRG